MEGTSSPAPMQQAENTPRLMISKMVLENFKSYAGVQEIGPFHKSFSSVVGPNGSGKSNVIDAMLFVFGKRAKQIRQNKLSELIHNSDAFPNLEYARVSVHFQDIIDKPDGEDYDVVEGSGLVVTRTARRNNQSTYHLDDKPSNFTEVTKLLRKRGIDLDHNRFLILQGEVEQIAMMKPKAPSPHEDGLLEYLEDIIGSNQYVEAIEAAAAKVENLNEARGEKLHRVKVVEKERENLEGAKLEAEAYLNKEKSLIGKRCALYQVYEKESQDNVATVKENKKELEERWSYEKKKLEEHEAALKETEKLFKKENKAYEAVSKEAAKSKEEFAAFERKDVQHNEELKHTKAKAKKAASQIKKDEKALGEATATLKAAKEDVVTNEKEQERLAAKLAVEEAALEEIYESLKGDTAELQGKLDAKQVEIDPYRKQVTEATSAVEVAASELELITKKESSVREKTAEVKAAIRKLKDDTAAKKKTIEEARVRKAQAEARIGDAEKELKEVAASEKALAREVQQLRIKVQEGEASQHASRSRSTVLEALMELGRTKLPGTVYGRLGDLGAIDSRYDVAISTACPQLDHIVVDSAETGKQCVEYLRKKNLGRASFILLDKIQGEVAPAMARPFSAPEGVPRLFDLVNPKADQFRVAFFFALSNTLVADDLTQARRIAYGGKRCRVVTLNGQLIDAAGTMTGGGNRVARGGMAASLSEDVSPKQLKDMQKAHDKAAADLADVRRRMEHLTREVASLQKELKTLAVDIPKSQMDIEASAGQIEALEGQLADLAGREGLNADEKKRAAELEKEVAQCTKTRDKHLAVVKRLEAEIAQLHEAILDVGGIRLRKAKSTVEGLASQIDAAANNGAKLQVTIKSSQKTVDKLTKSIANGKKNVEELTSKAEEMVKEFKTIEEEALKVMQSYEEIKQVLEEKEAALEGLRKEYDSKKKMVEKIRSVEVDITSQMEDYDRMIKENQKKADHWTKQLKGLAKELVDLAVEGVTVEEGENDRILRTLSEEEMKEMDKEGIQTDIAMLEEELKAIQPNMTAIAEYMAKEKDYQERVGELDELTVQRDAERAAHETLRKKRLDDFMGGFSVIKMKVKEMYQMITLGGDAELELVDSLDPFSEGIVFSVRPLKKSWKNISNLSGGEKTLSSLALVFALHHYKPTPLYVMDEIDAALDFKNVSIVANYIKERTRNAQFIIISLRNNMFEVADRLVGIYKTNDATKSVTINPHNISIPAR